MDKYLKNAVNLANDNNATDKKSIARKAQTQFHLAHYADALFRNYEERLTSNEWQAAMRLRKHKVVYTLFSIINSWCAKYDYKNYLITILIQFCTQSDLEGCVH